MFVCVCVCQRVHKNSLCAATPPMGGGGAEPKSPKSHGTRDKPGGGVRNRGPRFLERPPGVCVILVACVILWCNSLACHGSLPDTAAPTVGPLVAFAMTCRSITRQPQRTAFDWPLLPPSSSLLFTAILTAVSVSFQRKPSSKRVCHPPVVPSCITQRMFAANNRMVRRLQLTVFSPPPPLRRFSLRQEKEKKLIHTGKGASFTAMSHSA